MLTTINLFLASFAVVALLGLQQINVERRDVLFAALTSPAIGAANWVLFKLLPGPTSWIDFAAYLLGGTVGIVASMWVHLLLIRLLERIQTTPIDDAPLLPTPLEQTHFDKLLQLAHQIAEDAARADIEGHCVADTVGVLYGKGFTWYDIRSAGDDEATVVDRAIEYLTLRKGVLVFHPVQRHLIRFAR